ncbi:hypothetical protein F5883DRAFT_564040, partial [Diaporthe sp. PMI_573]
MKVRRRRKVRSLFLTALAIGQQSPGGQNVGRASGTCGKTEDKSAAANAIIPVFSRPNTVVYWSGPDHLMFRPPR